MNTTHSLRGVMPAIVTPLDEEGRFMPSALEKLLEFVYANGVDGIYVCGQTGEGLQQPAAQRKLVTETAVRCSPEGKQVIVHVGANSTIEAVDLARHAVRAGAHAVSSLPPLMGHSFAEIRSYYRDLAAASDAPLLIYFFPDLCQSIAQPDQIVELAALPNVAGLKFTDYDLYKLWRIKQHGAVIFNGRDEIFAAGLLMGADGGIGSFYNLAPRWFADVYRLAGEGRWDQARAIQRDINRLIEIGLSVPALSGIKLMLKWAGIDCGRCAAPRAELTAEHEASLRRKMESSGLAEALGLTAMAR
jgi:N-acetylneuraminate lyase